MEKLRLAGRKITPVLHLALGILLWCETLSFLLDLASVQQRFRQAGIAHTFLVLLIVLLTGFGLDCGARLTQRRQPAWNSALIFALLFFLLQVALVMMPAYASCKCLNIKENLLFIQDWGYSIPALLVLLFAALCRYLAGSGSKSGS